ncbi:MULTISPECIES: HAD family hydrolase [Halomonas]|uniref:HAD family hydrolase n=1 Tax=Halomonas citrativorans TaxID=2742612 RepID=A0ABR9FCM1_9GAMM|nr:MULTISPECIES: HAD family hydrolase [Halomonas]MBE0404232.1 HAD family hydrolase [Halomonas citrativorans]HCR96793.1 Cof-type HAD-IIB family hydrolase [Halomonas sp.]
MTPRLIVSDLDGTLLGRDHRLHEDTIEVLRTLVNQGHLLVLASGRHYADMRVFRDQLNVPIHLISSNGAYTHDPNDQLLAAYHVGSPQAAALIKLPRPDNVRLSLYLDDAWYIDAESPSHLEMHAATGFVYQVVPPEKMPTEGIGKVLYGGRPDALLKVETAIREINDGSLHVTYSTSDSLEIMAGGVNKGVALSALLKRLSVAPEDCLAFGDNLNDVEMLSLVGEPHFMINSHPEMAGRLNAARQIGHHGEAAVAVLLRERFAL